MGTGSVSATNSAIEKRKVALPEVNGPVLTWKLNRRRNFGVLVSCRSPADTVLG